MSDAAPTPAPKLDQVPVRSPDGTVGTVPKAQLKAALDAGAEVVGPDELAQAALQAKYGGLGGEAAAGAVGVARGLTLGLSDAAAVELGGEGARETLAGLKTANPNASLGGEVAGAIAPVVLSGGAAAPEEAAAIGARAAGEGLTLGKAIRGIGALPRGVAAIGGAAERGAARLVGEGATGVLGRVAQRAIPMAAGGAAEGAIYGAGQEVSDAFLDNHELTAEKLLASAGHGAFLAGAAGGVLGTGATLLQVGAEKLAVDAESLDAFASQNAYQALNPTLKQVQKTQARGAERVAEIGRDIIDQVAPTLEKPFWKASLDEIATATRKRAGEVGEQLGGLLKNLDASGAAAPDLAAIIARADQEVVTPLLGKAGFKGVARDVAGYLQELGSVAPEGVTFEGLAKQRRALDDLIYRESTPLNPSPRVEELRKVRRIMEEELERAGDTAAKQVGGSFLPEYQQAKKLYGNLTEAANIAEKSAARELKNRSFSLSDYMSGLSALVAGGMSPVSLATGFITGAVHKFFREHGRAMLAMGADTIAKTGKMRALSEGVDREVTKHVKTFFAKTPRELIADTSAPIAARHPYREASPREAYEKTSAEVANAAANPEATTARVAQSLGEMHRYAPSIAAAMASKSTATAAYLATKLPKRTRDPDSLTPHLDKPRVSDVEADRFMRYVRGTDARKVAQDLSAMRLARESVEAFRETSPMLYEQFTAHVHEQLPKLKEPMPYQKELQLRILLGKPTANAALVKQIDAALKDEPKNGHGGGPEPSPIHVTVDQRSESERIEAR